MKTRSPHDAFTLVEVTLALGIAAFCLLPLLGLLPLAINSNSTSLEQTAAANLITRFVSDLQATPVANTTSPIFALPLSGDKTVYLAEDGTVSATAGGARYRVRTITSLGTGGNHAATLARILVTWPVAADPASNATGHLETVIGLNRN